MKTALKLFYISTTILFIALITLSLIPNIYNYNPIEDVIYSVFNFPAGTLEMFPYLAAPVFIAITIKSYRALVNMSYIPRKLIVTQIILTVMLAGWVASYTFNNLNAIQGPCTASASHPSCHLSRPDNYQQLNTVPAILAFILVFAVGMVPYLINRKLLQANTKSLGGGGLRQ